MGCEVQPDESICEFLGGGSELIAVEAPSEELIGMDHSVPGGLQKTTVEVVSWASLQVGHGPVVTEKERFS